MNKRRNLILGPALGLALLAGAANAELLLSGNTAGVFQGSSSGNTVITNSPDGLAAAFRTGVPVSGSFQSGVVFTGQDFTNISNGDTFALGLITYYNGITLIGTSSASAPFDFFLNLSDPAMGPLLLTTISFGIDATVNSPSNMNPDQFTASFTQPAPVLIGGQWVKFTIDDLPTSTLVAENTIVELANVTVTYLNPVPEPATYGLIGAIGLMGLAGYRRFRAQRGGRTPLLPAAA